MASKFSELAKNFEDPEFVARMTVDYEFRHKTFGNAGFVQFPTHLQLIFFGLIDADIDKVDKMIRNDEQVKLDNLKGKRILDIGCGRDANLVYYLREQGIDAEGIDPCVNKPESFLMQQAVSGIKPVSGSIPREDNSYDLIFANSNRKLVNALGGCRDYLIQNMREGLEEEQIREIMNNSVMDSTFITLEGLRVLKQGGQFISYPGLLGINEVSIVGSILGLEAKVENFPVSSNFSEASILRERILYEDNKKIMEDYIRSLECRTVITKK